MCLLLFWSLWWDFLFTIYSTRTVAIFEPSTNSQFCLVETNRHPFVQLNWVNDNNFWIFMRPKLHCTKTMVNVHFMIYPLVGQIGGVAAAVLLQKIFYGFISYIIKLYVTCKNFSCDDGGSATKIAISHFFFTKLSKFRWFYYESWIKRFVFFCPKMVNILRLVRLVKFESIKKARRGSIEFSTVCGVRGMSARKFLEWDFFGRL